MKVLQLVRALDIGGLEQVVINITKHFEERHQFELFLGCLFFRGTRFDEAKTHIAWVGNPEADNSYLHLPTFIDLVRFLKKYKIDIIHSHNPVPHRYAYFASLFTGIPIVHTKHGRNYPKNKKAVWLNRLYASRSRRIVAVSKDAAKVSIDIEKINPQKVTTIVNGIDTEQFKPRPEVAIDLRRKNGIPDDSFVIGSVGRLAPEKDYLLLLESFAKAFPTNEKVHLLLVGDGSEKSQLLQKAKDLDVENRVHLPGMQKNTEMWYPCMDVFCLTSITEGTSITLLESAAAGLPAVVSDVGGNADIVTHQETGYVINPRNKLSLYGESFKKLFSSKKLRITMGTKAREKIVQCYSLKAMIEGYQRCYTSTCKTR
ncbi:MAG: glycosyltransferase [Opitutales bacterium]|nr:glycosyltransferase [Opitutales bacterium]